MTDVGPISAAIIRKLEDAFRPHTLTVIDESNQHHGHAGAHPSGESHFRIRIKADAFSGKSRVAQHRLINNVLAQELKARVHALAIEILA